MDGDPAMLSDETLLSECIVTTFRSNGKGGQHANKTDSAVRIKHVPTGVVSVCQRERSQYLNKMECLKRLRDRIGKLSEVRRPRIATEVPFTEKIRRREGKVQRSRKKKSRQKVAIAED